ncbi:MAG: phage holin family protein [Kineosporiaceae bacterium]
MSAPTGVPGYTGGPVQPDAVTHPDRLEVENHSLGELIGRLSGDFSKLVRQEIALAKTEAKEEATAAGKGVGLLGGAGVAGNIALIFLSLTVMFVLDTFLPIAWAALIVTVIWVIAAAVLAQAGRTKLKQVGTPLDETTETLKEDAQWARSLKS